ncbi:MAG: ATP-binding protein [Candidatus Woesearchaeota archaeon]
MKEVYKKLILENLERAKVSLVNRNIDFSETDITALIGPRRAGKTFCMFEMIQKLNFNQVLFLDFEDYRLINLNNFDLILEAYQELFNNNPKFLFLDEIQSLKNWQKIIRTLHNNGFKIIISGSSSKLLSKEIATELRGRYISKIILPFSFNEFLKLKNVTLTKDLIYLKKGILNNLINEYLKFGGFPEVIKKEKEQEKKDLLKSYYETIFYKDLSERYKIEQPENLLILMNYLLSNFSKYFSISKFTNFLKSNSISISKKTISKFLYELSESFFIISSEKYSISLKKRIFNPKKIYLIDNGFSNLMLFNEDKGKLLENLIAIELKRRSKEFYYFSEKNEVDFLIKESNLIKEAIQVTFGITETNKKREFNGLLEAMEKFNLNQSLIITFDQESEEKINNKKIKIIPFLKFISSF